MSLHDEIARRRGFFLEEEVTSDLVPDAGKDLLPVVGGTGQVVGYLRVPKEETAVPPPEQNRLQRLELLARLEWAEAQAFAGALLLPGLVEPEASAATSADAAGSASSPPRAPAVDAEDAGGIRPLLDLLKSSETWAGNLEKDPSAVDATSAKSERLVSELKRRGLARRAWQRWMLRWGAVLQQRSDAAPVLAWVRKAGALRREILEGNFGLVWFTLRKFGRVVDPEASFRAGVAGFNRALDSFDLSRGATLATYSVHWIRQSVSRQGQNHRSTIRIPVHLQDQMDKWRHAFAAEWDFGHDRVAVAERTRGKRRDLALSPERQWKLSELLQATVVSSGSLPGTTGAPGDQAWSPDWTPGVLLPSATPEAALSRVCGLLWACVLLAQGDDPVTSARDTKVTRRRLGLDVMTIPTLEELGLEFGVTRERIRQIEAKVFKRVRARRSAELAALLREVGLDG